MCGVLGLSRTKNFLVKYVELKTYPSPQQMMNASAPEQKSTIVNVQFSGLRFRHQAFGL